VHFSPALYFVVQDFTVLKLLAYFLDGCL